MWKGDFHKKNYLNFRCWNVPNDCSICEESRTNSENYEGRNIFMANITGVLNFILLDNIPEYKMKYELCIVVIDFENGFSKKS